VPASNCADGMKVSAQAPGKLVVIGEYAVLAGGVALVMAVDRYAVATLDGAAATQCVLHTRADVAATATFLPGAASGVRLVDTVCARWPAADARAWVASLDSRELYDHGAKLGLGSSAAALCAWAGAWRAFHGDPLPAAADLIALHRASQGGGGSGLDVAASRNGGVVTYALDAANSPAIGSAGLPDGVAFVAVSTGRPVATPVLLRRFAAWRASAPRVAAATLERLSEVAATGVAAAAGNATGDFLAAIEQYAAGLDELGQAMGIEITTAEHRAIAAAAQRCGVAYKVSGAGGGDIGLAFAASAAALDAFRAAVPRGSRIIDVDVAGDGLAVRSVAE